MMSWAKHFFTTSTIALLLSLSTPALAIEPIFENFLGKAIRGYDPVAYFIEGKPVEGKSEHLFEWRDSKWYFASKENLERFAGNPEQYAPQYGGYCAWAVSQGYTASIDPEAWTIHDGKLYLNYSKDVQAKWSQDIPGNISKGDSNWPGLLAGN
jgi:YHS domain-containing protein